MGNTIIHSENSHQPYQLVREEPHIKIVVDKNKQQQLAMRELCYTSESVYDSECKKCSIRQGSLDCENILQMVKMETNEQKGVCSNLFKITMIFEYPRIRLIDEIKARREEDKFFEEGQLFCVLQSCIKAQLVLQKKIIISPDAIFVDQEGIVKIINPDLMAANYQSVYQDCLYYSAEKFENFNIIELNGEEQEQKEAIFSIGMTLLHATLLKSVKPCYELSVKKFNRKRLYEYLSEISQQYSDFLRETLMIMLELNPSKRANLDDVQSCINTFFTSQSLELSHQTENYKLNSSYNHFEQMVVRDNQKAKILPFPIAQSIQWQAKSIQSNQLGTNKGSYAQEGFIIKTNDNGKTGKENLFTDPKLMSMVKEGMKKIRQKDIEKQRETDKGSNVYHTGEVIGRIYSKDVLSDYEVDSTNRSSKCVYVVEVYEDKTKFQGMMINRIKNGFGKLTYPDGVYFEGNFKNDIISGKGTLYYEKDRPAYSGDWQNDQFHGKGVLYNQYSLPLETTFNYQDFSKVTDFWIKYEGQFFCDKQNGQGRLTLTNGQTIEGNFQNGELQGNGVFTGLNGQKIVGHWHKNILQ